MTKPILTCHKISKSYHKNQPLFTDVSLNVEEGKKIALCGRSGSGKTTLLHILATLDSPETGIVNYRDNLPFSKVLLNVGFVFQSFHLLEDRTVLENVLLPVQIARIPTRTLVSKALNLLEELHILPLANTKVSYLSGGEKQRVALARALILDPICIFADEPTGNLDKETAQTIKELLFHIVTTQNKALVLVTHDKEFAANCDSVFELQEAKLLQIK